MISSYKKCKFWNGNVKSFEKKEELEGGIQAHPHGGNIPNLVHT